MTGLSRLFQKKRKKQPPSGPGGTMQQSVTWGWSAFRKGVALVCLCWLGYAGLLWYWFGRAETPADDGISFIVYSQAFEECFGFPAEALSGSAAQPWIEAGTFGDMFGGLNTLLTGFAFIGLLFTIGLQRHELDETRHEFEKQTRQFRIQSEIMMKQVLDSALFDYLQYMCKIKDGSPESFTKIMRVLHSLQGDLSQAVLCLELKNWQQLGMMQTNINGQILSWNEAICHYANALRRELVTLAPWRRIFTLWMKRVEKANSYEVDADLETEQKREQEEKLSAIKNEYKLSLWRLLSMEERFIAYLQTALYANSYHQEDWQQMEALFGEHIVIRDMFHSLKFKASEQKILMALLLAPPGAYGTPELTADQVQEIIFAVLDVRNS